jgi:hypothetical protein
MMSQCNIKFQFARMDRASNRLQMAIVAMAVNRRDGRDDCVCVCMALKNYSRGANTRARPIDAMLR